MSAFQEAAVEAEVEALAALDLEGMRAAWRARYGAPPRVRSADFVRRMLAWKIQADALGGLDAETHRLLKAKAAPAPRGPKVEAGARLVREWKGERHEAQVLSDGVRYRGTSYASLSEVARAITGVRWNGPRFFGLRGGA